MRCCIELICLLLAAPILAEQPPNVVLLVADGLGWGDLGIQGQKHFRTKRLDRLAAEGMRLSRHYAGSPVASASRAALLTGRPTEGPLRSQDTTLAELARQAGYRTAALGIWGLGGPGSGGIPTVQGFDEWFGYLEESDLKSHFPEAGLSRNEEPVRFPEREYAPYLFTRAATNFVSLRKRQPFFLYYAATIPHPPIESPSTRPYSGEDWPLPQKTLAAMIHRLDREVGRILDALEHHDLTRRTAVFFTSSTGPRASEGIDPRFFDSTGGLEGVAGTLHEGGLRVPLLVRWPGRIKPGSISDRSAGAADLHATIAEILGAEAIRGTSFLPTLLGRRQRSPEPLFWSRGTARAVLDHPWKAVQSSPEAPIRLHRLDRDPSESTDLSERYSRTLRRLLRLLNNVPDDLP